ncbi:MAG: DUF4080 domain-containing protein [Pseudobdellovibrio sp.]
MNPSYNKDILLCTLNSTYQHSSFGLRYIFAQMGDLTDKTELIEWTIKENPRNIVEKILSYNPKIVGFGVYIWNTDEIFKVCSVLKKVAPHIELVLGGPEISYETETQKLYQLADHIICGEADFSFRDFCMQHLNGETHQEKIIRSILPAIDQIQLPYYLYNENDIANRVIYVEASRGCPYKCEYCLSSLDKSVRSFNLDLFLIEMQKLIERGAQSFKFVDRTFNLSPTTSTRILNFFLEQLNKKQLFLHFEMVPDRLPQEIRTLIKQFPHGTLQFEVGIQTLNPVVAANVSRKNDLIKVEENFKYIRENTHVHTHADLIVGLPGETMESFASGFDRLAVMGPDEIQVGILKRLKGTPIIRHEKTFDMRYQDFPPYQILSTDTMSYQNLQTMNRFAKFWDLYANSGDFPHFMKWMKETEGSFFNRFMRFVDFLSEKYSETHSISLINLSEKAWLYIQEQLIASGATEEEALSFAIETIKADYCDGYKKRDIPPFMKPFYRDPKSGTSENAHLPIYKTSVKKNKLNERQLQHVGES